MNRCIAAFWVLILSSLAFGGGTRVHAQRAEGKTCESSLVQPTVDVADHGAVQLRAAQLYDSLPPMSLTIRRPSLDRARNACAGAAAAAGSIRMNVLPLRARIIHNSAYPLDINNGALWAGRGLNAAASAGIELAVGRFSAAIYPTFAFQQNAEFTFQTAPEPYSRFTYPWHVIDWPQRHGSSSFTTLDPGQSYARVELAGVTAGVSTENLWWGPALRMPLLMGNSAPGFPHVFAGTAAPVDVRIGMLDVQLLWGRVRESAYFDDDSSNNQPRMAGIAAVFEPAIAPGLFVGVNRVYLANAESGASLLHELIDPYIDVRKNTTTENQLLSVYARWLHPAVGFEVYAEWARDDHWGDVHDLLREPDHSQAYLLGFQKSGRWRGGRLRWFGELAHLQASQTLRSGRGIVTFYTHGGVIQGYTHRGQLLGAWIGPGSDGQVLGVEHTTGRRSTLVAVERVRFAADAYYNQWARFFAQNGHDVAIGGMVQHVEHLGAFSLKAGVAYANRQNRGFAHLNEAAPHWFVYENNVQLDLEARWVPRGKRQE